MSSPSSPNGRRDSPTQSNDDTKNKLHGRAFYESIGSPKLIMAPMVDQSEFAWRLLSRSFLPESQQTSLLCYSPMMHSRLFATTAKYRDHHFCPTRKPLSNQHQQSPSTSSQDQGTSTQAYLDGNPNNDRPLFVQFCSNTPTDFLAAATLVAPHCDAVDLNLGCPQGIARRGNYGAFLQDDWDTVYNLINTLHKNLPVPVTAKMRILESKERTLEYAQMILRAGASFIAVHGRVREQKGHRTGVADWEYIRYLRDNLPPETVIFANGNILQHEDIEACLDATGADGVMSAEGNLSDPTIFAEPPAVGEEGREYWRGRDGRGGWRMDAIVRRYLDIIHRYILEQDPPKRPPLFLPSDPPQTHPTVETSSTATSIDPAPADSTTAPTTTHQKRTSTSSASAPSPSAKKQKKTPSSRAPLHHNLTTIQPHLFTLLRPLVSKHTAIRDALARARARTDPSTGAGDIAAFEDVLTMVEDAVAQGLRDYEAGAEEFAEYDSNAAFRKRSAGHSGSDDGGRAGVDDDAGISSRAAVLRCKRPWFVCQAYVRPLPAEAVEKGAITLSAKEKARLEAERRAAVAVVGVEKDEKMEKEGSREGREVENARGEEVEVPREGVVCG